MSRGVAIVVSRYNASVTSRMLEGALEAFRGRRPGEDVSVYEAPGAFELPAIAAACARAGFEGVVCLGCVIKGETIHDRVIADAIAGALAAMPAQLGVPAALGVLTVDTPAQAAARAGGEKGNKGFEAMEALLDTIDTIRAIETGEAPGASGPKPDKAT